MNLGEIIKEYRKTNKISMGDLAEKTGISKSYISIIESNFKMNGRKKAPVPSIQTIKKLADGTGLNFEDLLKSIDGEISLVENDDIKVNNIHPITFKKIPMLGSIACGEPIYADQEYEMVDMAESNVHADFCLTAQGDSMINARIFDGDIVFIQSSQEVPDGSIAAVIIDDTATLKRFYYHKEQNMVVLRAENPMYKDLIFMNDDISKIRVLGKAVAFQSYIK